MRKFIFILLSIFVVAFVFESCKDKEPEPVAVEAPKPEPKPKKEPPTPSKSAKDVAIALESNGGLERTVNIYRGQMTAYRYVDGETFFSFHQMGAILAKYHLYPCWIGSKWNSKGERSSLQVGNPPWDKISDIEVLKNKRTEIIYDFKKTHKPGEEFFVLGPYKLTYWSKFVGDNGNEEYFLYYGKNMKEFPLVH